MHCLIRIIERSDGVATEHDNCYVREYDPRITGRDPDGVHWIHLLSTDQPDRAKVFASAAEALEYSKQENGVRPDGKPNRPLTAYTVEIVPMPDSAPD